MPVAEFQAIRHPQDERAEQYRREVGLHRARAREADVRHRFFSVNADNRPVAADLEKEWEATKRDVQRLERLIQSEAQAPVIFDEAAFEELMTLCADIGAIWNAPTTTNRDRKELLRAMIHAVRTSESIRVAIEWADGAPSLVLDTALAPRAHRQIQELADEGVPSGRDRTPPEPRRHLDLEGAAVDPTRP